MKQLFISVLIFSILLGCKQSECELAELKAKMEFGNEDFKLHSLENFPVENTYFYVLSEKFDVKWRFIGSDSIEYYNCYDSIMTTLLNERFGLDFKSRAKSISDSLEGLNNWNSPPKFKGGQTELYKFISNRLEISKDELGSSIGSRVKLEFEINENGEVINPIIRNGINAKIDQKLIEIINELPNWTPGFQFGKPISKKFIIPIYIDIN
ncbi:hypothetical protein [Flagellimonas beolgyonensis]|uniref:hypothetical protein n=1 Tax=Flagellimonas beolgyonensis TaxID=864064 RepID=UPI003D661FB2